MRVLIDSNVFISYLLDPIRMGPVQQAVEAGLVGVYTLLVSQVLPQEFTAKIQVKKYLADRITLEQVARLTSTLLDVAEIIPGITENIPSVTRDPKDDYLVAYALVGQADYLVTRDKDLLVLGQIDIVKIITPQEMWGICQSNRIHKATIRRFLLCVDLPG